MMDDKLNKSKQNESKRTRSTMPAAPTSRSERKQSNSRNREAVPEKTFWVQIRIIPIWLRIVLVLLLLFGAAIFGAMVGYGYIGGGEPKDVLKKETWTHILDIIKGKEL